MAHVDPASGRVIADFEQRKKKLEKEIDECCDETLEDTNWLKIFEIIDSLNRTTYLCAFAIAAIRRKLKTKNGKIEILALDLLEAIIKNVPASHASVATPSFMRYLVKVGLDTRKRKKGNAIANFGKKLKKENDENGKNENEILKGKVIAKALLILHLLNKAYEKSNRFPIFVDTYKQLLKRGVKFDDILQNDGSALGSIKQTENESIASMKNIDNNEHALPMITPVTLIANVTDDTFKTAQENASFFFEILNSTAESGSQLSKNELITELYRSVCEWQARVIDKVSDPTMTDESVVSQGLKINEMLHQLLDDYQCLKDGTKRRFESESIGKNIAMSNDDKKEEKEKEKEMEKGKEKEKEKEKENDNGNGNVKEEKISENDSKNDGKNEKKNEKELSDMEKRIYDEMPDSSDEDDDGIDMDVLELNIFDILATKKRSKSNAHNNTDNNDEHNNKDKQTQDSNDKLKESKHKPDNSYLD